MHSKASVQCAACGESRWRFAEAAYVRVLLEPGEADLNEDSGVVKVSAATAGTYRVGASSNLPRVGAWRDIKLYGNHHTLF
jgi:hypothetical protein